MASKPRGTRRQAEDHGDFAGPDADKENLEKIAAAAAAENATKGVGHNSGDPSPEAITRSGNAIEAALVEIDVAGRIMQKARAELAAAQKTAKTDLGSKSWVETVKAAVKLKRQADKGGTGEIVTEHRQMGIVLRTLDVPLYTQFGLFAESVLPEASTPAPANGESTQATENEAELRGEQDYKQGLKMTDNYYQPGTPEYVAWGTGWVRAQKANVAGVGGTDGDGGTSPGDTTH